MAPSFFISQPKQLVSNTPPPDATRLYTDGGYKAQNGVGAWAWRAALPSGKSMAKGRAQFETTNNRMELMAVIDALETLEIGPPITIVADSEYVLKGMTQWTHNWAKFGWKTAAGDPVKNKDLWERLVALRDLHQLTYQHVPGHSGHEENEYVDKVCSHLMKDLVQQSKLKPVTVVEWEGFP
jgi:ribonuclease HI